MKKIFIIGVPVVVICLFSQYIKDDLGFMALCFLSIICGFVVDKAITK